MVIKDGEVLSCTSEALSQIYLMLSAYNEVKIYQEKLEDYADESLDYPCLCSKFDTITEKSSIPSVGDYVIFYKPSSCSIYN